MNTPDNMFRLEGKVALVTGATSGIGQQQAKALSAAGATIIASGRDGGRLDTLLRDLPGQGVAVKCDLATADVSTVFSEAIADTGGCLLYTSPSPRDGLLSRMPSSA